MDIQWPRGVDIRKGRDYICNHNCIIGQPRSMFSIFTFN